ncbi:MAG: DegT/DnrJ/EryC1/StrS family aminotransferase [Clostridiales bacterium]|jgi:perosamine synthetase|nr:DegT/DnrJ/EryC1/StrS family aminotransferase [Clostridiales bacterium]
MSQLALFGGPKAVTLPAGNIFDWPIITKEDEDACLEVLRKGGMSGTDVTMKFEEEFAAWNGVKYALGFSSGTASLQAAMYGVGIRRGDEMIMPSLTYWASGLQLFSLGATPVFANVDRDTLCIDPADIEHRIGPRTKAIMCVHYVGHPCDMDAICAIAKKHNLKVIEDISHAQGGLYKGRKLGTFGDVAALSLMSGKSLATGEAGMLITNDRYIYEHAMCLGHYERMTEKNLTCEDLLPYVGLPMGGYKYRMHQLSSAVGRVQLKYYDARCEEIRRAMNYFWDCLEGVPGLRAHRTAKDSGSNMAGWYAAKGLYRPEELGGLSVTRFCEAAAAEGAPASPGCNLALHTHPLFHEADVYGDGKPTRIAFSDRDVRELDADLKPSVDIGALTYNIPWFKHYVPEIIEQYAEAYKKAALNYKELLPGDHGNSKKLGGFHFFKHTK